MMPITKQTDSWVKLNRKDKTMTDFFGELIRKGFISVEKQTQDGQHYIQMWEKIQLQKARDKADRILSLWKIVAQSIPLLVDANPMQYDRLADYEVLFAYQPLLIAGIRTN